MLVKVLNLCVVIVICCCGYTAGEVVYVDNSLSNPKQSIPAVMEAFNLVAVHLLEPVPARDAEPVSVQGRLDVHERFWVDDLESSSFVRGLWVPYTIPSLTMACFQVQSLVSIGAS